MEVNYADILAYLFIPGGRIKIDIVRDTTTLTVFDADSEDTGRYTLVVENELGVDNCSSSVTVEGMYHIDVSLIFVVFGDGQSGLGNLK